MLVLTRKVDEQILIGDDIKITLIRVRGNNVRIGIEAPRSVRVVRGELGKRESEAVSKVEVELEMDGDHVMGGELDDLAAVFAHPELQVRARKATAKPKNRIDELKTIGQEPQVFVGSIKRNGENAKVRRAPLASFVSAS